MLLKSVIKEVLVNRIQGLGKQQEFNKLAMPCWLYDCQEFVRFHA